MRELEDRLPRLRIPLLASVVWALQTGWWLTSDGLGLRPHLPIVLCVLGAILMLHHGFTAETWAGAQRAKAWRRVGIIAALLVAAAAVNFRDAPIDVAGKITVVAFVVFSIFYVWLFTRVVFPIAERSSVARRPKRRAR